MIPDFCAMILTHGRPNHVPTYRVLRNGGYTGPIVIVIDNEDDTADEYRERFGSEVVMFDKKAVADMIDEADNFSDRRSIVYARNAAFDIAEELGYTYFIQLDDDYTYWSYCFDEDMNFLYRPVKRLDDAFRYLLDYYKATPAKSLCIAQTGDYIGGENAGMAQEPMMKRKAMNTFICSTERRFQFNGRINEDVNAYTLLGSRGELFLTVNLMRINQGDTQKSEGGMTDIYLVNGTYIKSFYTVIHCPSSVRIGMIGDKHPRIHHQIRWNNTVPKILNEDIRRPDKNGGETE